MILDTFIKTIGAYYGKRDNSILFATHNLYLILKLDLFIIPNIKEKIESYYFFVKKIQKYE